MYIAGHATNTGEKTMAYRFKKGCKQGSPDATDLYCYGAFAITRTMKAELCQHPSDYHYLIPLRETEAISSPSMAFATPLGRDRPLCPPANTEVDGHGRLVVPFEPSLREPTGAVSESPDTELGP